MSEKQAWEFLADQFGNPNNLKYASIRRKEVYYVLDGEFWGSHEPSGICDAVKVLACKEELSPEDRDTMLDKVVQFAPQHGEGEYAWDITNLDGFRQRAEFCRQMANECEEVGYGPRS